MKTIIESHCGDDCYEAVGARKLKNSLKHFHPEVPLHIYGDAEIAEFRNIYPWLQWASMDPVLCGKLAEEYDMVVHIDADSIITGTLDELLLGDFDIAGVRNNNDIGLASGCGCTLGNHIPGIDAATQYLNAGLVAVKNKEFWVEFLSRNAVMANEAFGEQDIWNKLFWGGKYKNKVLDPKEANVYYGVSAQLCKPGYPMQECWSRMYMEKSNLCFNGKVVKIIHNAGGFGLPKLQYQTWVTPEVKDFLDTITKD